MLSKMFQIDDIDQDIIKLVQEDPTLTHTEIAKKVNRSQPTIGMRIKKLEKSGVLKFQAGINLKSTDLLFARVEIQVLKPDEIIELVKRCPYMLNAFKLSGTSNLSVLIIGTKLSHLDNIVNNHFRKNPNISLVHMDIITDIVYDFVLPFDFNFNECKTNLNHKCCSKCF